MIPSVLTVPALSLSLSLLAATAAPPARQDGELRERAVRAIDAGEFERAQDLLDELLGRARLADAREHLAAGRPEDALFALDRSLEHRPGHPEALLLRAEGHLALAVRAASGGATALFVEGAFQDALAAFQEVPVEGPEAGVRVLFGASRAAWFLGRGAEALDYARRGMELVADGAPVAPLTAAPERTWAEASFLAYREARGNEAADDARALFLETRDALERLLARVPGDPWTWTQLARLYQWEGRLEEATAQLQRGLDHWPFPPHEGMLAMLVEIAQARGGAAAAIAELDALLARYPEIIPLGYWYRARVRFDDALTRLLAGEPDVAAFRAAEADFARCRELAAEHESDCRGYEVMCRDAIGWCHYNAEDYDAARDAFLSMEEVLEGGLDWAMEGQLLSGIQGLEFVAEAYNEREDWASAAEVFDALRAVRPEESKWANNAGFFHRDAGVRLELIGRRLCEAAGGDALPADLAAELARVHAGFGATPDECRALADEYLEAAREHMRASYDAYRDAARLAPDDVRIVNDTALVAVYYLHEDLDLAEELLRRSIAMGAEQLASRELGEEERYDLENAWGDAFQNLGVLILWRRGDREEARALLQRSLELGDSRPLVRERLLPLCDASEAELAAAEDQGLRPWAVPCE